MKRMTSGYECSGAVGRPSVGATPAATVAGTKRSAGRLANSPMSSMTFWKAAAVVPCCTW